jgi:hypothetical protein
MSSTRWTVVAALALAAACSGDDPTGPAYEPELPTAWSARVTNPWFPLIPGTVWQYRNQTEDGLETIRVEVLSATRVVNGVTATIVHDEVFLDGSLIEDTFDWYAQDSDGNVWYLGEDTKELENGRVVNTDGSWEWGKNGALPGIYMWANPGAHMGESYRQEFYRDEAEDWGKVIAVDASVTVPAGTFTGCVKTEDWNAIEGRANTLEHKYYCSGRGTVLEHPAGEPTERVELIQITP